MESGRHQIVGLETVAVLRTQAGFSRRRCHSPWLYYLAATNRAHTRDALATLLYPDYPTSQAKKNLRAALYHLRSRLDPFLTVTRNAVHLKSGNNREPQPAIDVDTIRFETLLDTHADGHRTTTEPTQLVAALDLYKGEFLEGFHVAG